MQKIRQIYTKALPFVSLVVISVVFILYVVSVYFAGGSPLGAFLFPLACVFLCLLPGLLLCRLLCPQLQGAGKYTLSFALGAVVLVLSYVAFGAFFPLWVCGIPCAALSIYELYYLFKNRRNVQLGRSFKQISSPFWVLLLVLAFAWVIQLFIGLFTYAHPGALGGSHLYHQDTAWSIGNAAAVQFGFPLVDIRMEGGSLHYHYFADALTGLLAYFSGQAVWDAWNYYAWPVYALLLIIGIYHAAKALGAKGYFALLPGLGAFLLHATGGDEIIAVYENRNAVINSYLFLIAALIVILYLQQINFKLGWPLLAFAIATAALVWTKSTTGLLFLCAVAAAALVYCLLRLKLFGRLWLYLLAGAGVYGIVYLFIISKAVNSIDFVFSANRFLTQLKFLWQNHMLLFILYVISLIINLLRIKHLSFTSLLINAFVIGGYLATSLFSHYAKSENYFILASVFFMWLCVTDAFAYLLTSKKKVVQISLISVTAIAAAISFIQTAPVAYAYMQPGIQSALRCMGLRPPFADYLHETYFSADDEAAALWLKNNMAKDEYFAINRTSHQLSLGDGVFHMYTALSERKSYCEGWFYSHQYSHGRFDAIHHLEEVSDVIFAYDDFESANQLAAENNIAYLVVYKLYKPDGFSGAEPVLENSSTYIYKVQ